MEELQAIRFLLGRIKSKVSILDKKSQIVDEARRLSDEDKKNGKGYTFWKKKN